MNQKNSFLNFVKATTLGLGLLALARPSHAEAQVNALSPIDVISLQSVTSSNISEDGKNIAYTLSQSSDPLKENKSSENHLYIYNTNSQNSIPYFTSSSVYSVDYRPGKKSLTFLNYSEDDKKTILYEIPLNGGSPKELFQFDRSISSYSWHPSGTTIAFTSTEKAESSTSKLPYQSEVFEENRPNRKLYIKDLENPDEARELKIEGSVYMLEWSTDGKHLAVSVSPSAEVDDYYMSQKVKILDPKSGEITAEIDNQGKIGQIVWSPTGDRLAIRAGADINDPIDGRILLVSAKGGSPKIIDRDFEGKYEQIEWSGNSVYFLASKGTSTVIGKIQADGSNKKILFSGEEFDIKSFSLSEDLISFIASTPNHPTELYSLENKIAAKPRRLTFNNEWLKEKDLGKQEVIKYKSRDGKYEIEGILIYPVHYEEGKEVPLITVVHGGPESHYSNGWLTGYSMPGQMAAAEGYAVFYPNYRGSTGRGIDFAYSSQADMSGKEFDDVVDGVDYLIAQGIADEDRIGVTGGSYGGYASAWMSTYYSDRFAAAVMFVGISNNLSKWGSSDIPDELFYVHARERIWESDSMWMNYLKRSPIYHVDKAETPILIMHGANDTRVHPAQSLELYRHIKVRKPEVPVRLVFFPGEGHGNRKATAQLDYALRMMQWFDTYLMTGDSSAEMPSWDVPMPKEK